MMATVRQLGTAGVAEVLDLDCRRAFDAPTLAAVHAAFAEYPVLVFRNNNLSPAEQVAFSTQFGPLELQHKSNFTVPGEPAVLILTNELRPDGSAIGVVDAGDAFHSDSQSSPVPCLATILCAIRNPETGGDTEYCDMRAVYDALPPATKQRLVGLTGVHHSSKLRNARVKVSANRPDAIEHYTAELALPEARHPLVRKHPVTGRPSLYASPRFTIGIDGLDETEGQRLLDELFTFMGDHRFRYRHRWSDGDLVMWDNRCMNHRATGGYALPDIRRMHRTVVAGTPPIGYTP